MMPTDPDTRRDPAAAFSDALDRRPAARRERDLRRCGPPRPRTQLVWIAIALGGLVLFVLLMRAVMEKTKWTAGPSAVEAVSTEATYDLDDTPPAAAGADPDTEPADSAPDCARVVRRVAGAWTDACGAPLPATPAEREHARRRADAAADTFAPEAAPQ